MLGTTKVYEQPYESSLTPPFTPLIRKSSKKKLLEESSSKGEFGKAWRRRGFAQSQSRRIVAHFEETGPIGIVMDKVDDNLLIVGLYGKALYMELQEGMVFDGCFTDDGPPKNGPNPPHGECKRRPVGQSEYPFEFINDRPGLKITFIKGVLPAGYNNPAVQKLIRYRKHMAQMRGETEPKLKVTGQDIHARAWAAAAVGTTANPAVSRALLKRGMHATWLDDIIPGLVSKLREDGYPPSEWASEVTAMKEDDLQKLLRDVQEYYTSTGTKRPAPVSETPEMSPGMVRAESEQTGEETPEAAVADVVGLMGATEEEEVADETWQDVQARAVHQQKEDEAAIAERPKITQEAWTPQDLIDLRRSYLPADGDVDEAGSRADFFGGKNRKLTRKKSPRKKSTRKKSTRTKSSRTKSIRKKSSIQKSNRKKSTRRKSLRKKSKSRRHR